ncbi:twin-arginine translocase subunit TatC [Nakamurella endophytica]|uniref:Sec-independent protein translocase protein TatC n=1 Tax=Nakamurella endophytica TaxID=1748367 RepID=A0A917WCF5_9ACTN|nr:twin-arginine translocase subunit TatC [Nakamurella endophytica]GGL91305.1 Sec-independent protein translocase protein TatC [Nakamurella endophytica]
MVGIPRRSRKDRPVDGTMSLMEHLYELRRRLFFAALGLLAGTVLGFVWYTVSIPALGLRSLNDILIAPYCNVPAQYRLVTGGREGCQLLATTPFSFLQVRIKAALMVGAVISSPVWLYQLWGFVTPALYSRERKFAVSFVVAGGALFFAGAALAYYVIGEGLKVLLSFAGDAGTSALSPDSYFSFLIAMLIIFGLSFEVPLLLVMLNFAGVLKGARLAASRRYAIFGMVVLAAVVVPGNDPVTMSALAIALAILYEVAVQVSKAHDRRKERRLVAAGMAELSDDEASPMPVEPGPVGHTDAVGGSSPVPPPAPIPPVEPPDRLGDAT